MKKETICNKKQSKPVKLIGIRHLQFTLLFLCVSIAYGMRIILSIGIVSMTDDNPSNLAIPTYPNWNKTDIILSSFFCGYASTQLAAGQLSEFFGPKWFMVMSMSVSSICSALIPLMAAQMGWGGVILCRVFQGIFQGFIYPSTHHLLSRWSSVSERALMSSFVYGGAMLGTVMAMLLGGIASSSSYGWPIGFYFYGVVGAVWTLLWIVFGANSPAEHKSISAAEIDYIGKVTDDADNKKLHTPWTSIMTSVPFWALLIAHVGSAWTLWTLITEIPTYMTKIMKYDIKENALLSALPYFTLWILGFPAGLTADKLIAARTMSTTNVRKLFQIIGSIIPAACLIALGFVDEHQRTLAVCLLVVSVGAAAGHGAGYGINHIDLGPNFAGTLLGITNTAGVMCSIFAPLTVGMLGYDQSDPVLWQIVFLIAACGLIVSTIVFGIFASGEVQPWNNLEKSRYTDDTIRSA